MEIREEIERLRGEVAAAQVGTPEEAESFRLAYLSRKGAISVLFDRFKGLSPDEKRANGGAINELKKLAQEKLASASESVASTSKSNATQEDLTRPPTPRLRGGIHPLAQIEREILGIFAEVGFRISEGPELEDDWHVFSALNFPPNHPARDMQDTFFSSHAPDILLRTHTSSVQVRTMERSQPPIRVLCPGRVYRNEDISARSHCQFHQIEGLAVDKGVTFADLKQVLLYFARRFFGEESTIRLRPSYFPFTEPSAEMDVSCNLCGGKGCNVCKGTGWLEILGCGMVHPNVLSASNIDPSLYTGYAFGMGIERIAMLRYGIDDIRLFFENDVRFLEQF